MTLLHCLHFLFCVWSQVHVALFSFATARLCHISMLPQISLPFQTDHLHQTHWTESFSASLILLMCFSSLVKTALFAPSSVPLNAVQLAIDFPHFVFSFITQKHLNQILMLCFPLSLSVAHVLLRDFAPLISYFCIDFPAVWRLCTALVLGRRHAFNLYACL